MVALAQRTDELGYDFIQIPEHIVMNHQWAGVMGPRWSHALSATGFVLGATKRVKVLCLLLVALHNPIELAKALATIDFMSGGRVIPVPMAGYMKWEFDLLKVPYAERGALMDEYMEAMIELWESDEPVYHGKYVQFDDVVFAPKPVQRPMPLWFGGRARPALRRIGRLGHGWVSSMVPRDRFREAVDYIRAQPGFQANPRPLELYAPMFEGKWHPEEHYVIEPAKILFEKDAILEQVQEIADLGVTFTVANELIGTGRWQRDTPDSPPPARNITEYLERLEWFAGEIMPDARRIEAAAA
jgi:probable F420-dependent oxidoreductase